MQNVKWVTRLVIGITLLVFIYLVGLRAFAFFGS